MTEEEISVQEQYEAVLETGDSTVVSEFLNEQNISDVAELIYENEDHETDILAKPFYASGHKPFQNSRTSHTEKNYQKPSSCKKRRAFK